MGIATIDPTQEYDIIQTLTFNSTGGSCNIRLYRGSASAYSGTVYVRAGTSGSWSAVSVSGTSSTFPVSNTTMQVAHDWNKSGNNYMTCSFRNQSSNLTKIEISQKAVLSGVVGNCFMSYYAYYCSSLTSLDVPDVSGVTSVGSDFMHYYASRCTSLTSLAIPDTSNVTSVGNYFMYYYASGCTSLTSLGVPDISGVTSVGSYFMYSYANSCSSLTSLDVPDTSNITSVGNSFMIYYANNCTSLTSLGIPDTSNITSVGSDFMRYYASGCTSLTSLGIPDTSSITSVGNSFMIYYAINCSSLTKLILPKTGWFATHNVDWSVPSGRLGLLKGYVIDGADLAGWQSLTVSGKTLYTNNIRSSSDVIYEAPPELKKYPLPALLR